MPKAESIPTESAPPVTGPPKKKRKKEKSQPAAAEAEAATDNIKEDAIAAKHAEEPEGGHQADGKQEDAHERGEDGEPEEEDAGPKGHRGSHFLQKKALEGKNIPTADKEGDQTVHVANLDWSVDEAKLREIYEQIPGFVEARLVKDFLGRSKGYAYIDYETSDQVE